MFNLLRRRHPEVGRTPDIPPMERTVAMGSVAVTDTTLHERVQPTVEALEIGGERLGALIQNVFAAEGPAPNTYQRIPRDLAITAYARTIAPTNLREGAPVESWSVSLPVDKFVYAPGLTDWQHGRADTKNGQPSSYVIGKYARMPADTAPPIQHVLVYSQPNGEMFCGLTGDGAHRLAAAKRREDNTIRARDVTFVRLDENVL